MDVPDEPMATIVARDGDLVAVLVLGFLDGEHGEDAADGEPQRRIGRMSSRANA